MKKLATGLLLTVALAGCGGGGGGGGAVPRLSKTDFRTTADGICRKYNAKIAGAMKGATNSPGALANGVEKALSFVRLGTKELDTLNPPQQYASQYKRFRELNHAQITTAVQLVKAARKKDRAGLNSAIATLQRQGNESDRLARQMGLHTCATG
jgi:hypothetical protein